MIKVEKLVVGQLATNCYLVWCSETKEAIIIDPGDAADYIIQNIKDLQLKPNLIVATHGHVDHILAVIDLKLVLQIPFFIHQEDLFLIKRIKSSARYWFGLESGPVPEVDQFIDSDDLIKFGKEKLKVIKTPGHSPGGVSFYDRGVLFSGDTLFRQGVGRYDFSYASKEQLNKSIKKLLKLPPETIVYPGHGSETTIGDEKFGSDLLFSSVF